MTVFFITAIVLFMIRIILFSIGAYRERHRPSSRPMNGFRPFVSVIVPARNEESNIRACIESIAKSSYPSANYEIVAVNDRSSDRTAEILESLKTEVPNLVVINVTEQNRNLNLLGKPGALQTGIESAKGEIILMTDADCTVTKKWLETVAGAYSDTTLGLTSSYTNIKGTRIFDKLQAAEWAYMHTMGAGGVGLNQPMGCYGNNMAVRREAFNKVGGYNDIKFSVTEDLALQRAVHKSGSRVRYLTDPDSAVETLPCRTFREYLNQHHRWATGGQALGWRAAIFVVTSAALWVAVIIALATGEFAWLGVIIGSRLLGDYMLVAPSLWALKKHSLNLWVFPSIFFFMLVELITPFMLLNKNIVWKGQVFRKN